MKYIILTKKSLFVFIFVCLVFTVICISVSEKTVTVSAESSRQIPIYCVDTQDKKISVTFDAAWEDYDTDDLIEILSKHNAKATFFIVGEWAQKYPESVKKLYDSGHEIANHSYNHTAYSTLTKKEIREDIEKCNNILASITSCKPTLLRAPSGDYTDTSETAAKETNMRTVQWSVDSLDWRGLTVDEIKSRVLPAVENGSILLFHNAVKNTPQALDEILTQLEKDGYSFVSVSELIFEKPYRIDITGKQIKE